MKISLAVPSYNYAQYIRACLLSIQTQTHEDFEVLIADGGSKDCSIEIIEEFCNKDPRFKLISRKDDGQPDAVNIALDLAVGDVLCFLNADDVYLADTVFSEIVKAFEAYKDVSIISAGGYYIDDSGRYIKPVRLRYHPLDNISWMKYRVACLQPAIFWKRQVYEKIGFKKEFHFSFDSVFFYEAYNCYSWLELTNTMAGYRLHGENKSMSVKSVRIKELANFEKIKFGEHSWRALYLRGISCIVGFFERLGTFGKVASRVLYLMVNSIAFISCYRLPGI
jgi:glycosyltransferase involved in cell wall biosynthesis